MKRRDHRARAAVTLFGEHALSASAVSRGGLMPLLRVEPDVTVELRDGETLLEGLYRDGYSYGVGCRRGGCGVCKVDLLVGAVRYPTTVSPDVLSDEERHNGTCLSCRAVPAGDITIALRADHLSRNSLLANLARPKPTGGPPVDRQPRTNEHNRRGDPR
jgi:ferredoxin